MDDVLSRHYDVAIVGSGAGGGTLAYGLARKGVKVLLIERGHHVPQEAANYSDEGAFGKKYWSLEFIERGGTKVPNPLYANVGGQTKFYGAALCRLRKEDFGELIFPDGVSPAWPITYEDLEPYYCQAEELYKVHGSVKEDPTEPFHSRPYPFAPVEHEGPVKHLVSKLQKQGLHVSAVPKGIDLRDGGNCTFCSTCDAYACATNGKMDAETACINPAIKTGNLTLITGATCRRLVTNEEGNQIVGIKLKYEGKMRSVDASFYVVSCGTINSPALLLKSANKTNPDGLANSSGMVGRNLCGHNSAVFLLSGLKKIPDIHQKTFAVNDFYFGDDKFPFPLGVMQAAGRMPVWQLVEGWRKPFAKIIAKRSLSCIVMSEVLPDPENRVSLNKEGMISIAYQANNLKVFKRLRSRFMNIFRRARYIGAISRTVTANGLPFHAVGTLRFGTDPKTSVLNTWCQTHDIDNLFVVDSCFMPSAGALNTSLTVMAQALRVADHIHGRLARMQVRTEATNLREQV